MFNAMLLPVKASGFGGPFQPLPFGRAASGFHIDHLIPESMLQENNPGYEEGHTLRNLAPLPSNQNRIAKATSCSSKLGAGGIYQNYIANPQALVHPYCAWLVQQQGGLGAALDAQMYLEANQNPAIGADRVTHIQSSLVTRL